MSEYLRMALALKDQPLEEIRPRPQCAGVYFVQHERTGPIKIGVAENIATRVSSLQIGNPYELRLIADIVGATARDEADLHHMFRRHWLRGEWFAPHQEIIVFARAMVLGRRWQWMYCSLHAAGTQREAQA